MTFRAVILSGSIVSVLTVLLASQLVVMRLLLLARMRRTERFLNVWEPLLFCAIDALPSDVPRVATADVFLWLTRWNHLQESVADEAKHRLNELARRVGVATIARGMLGRRHVRDRLIAIATLGHLRDQSVWDALCTCAASPHVVESFTAARALVQIDPRAAIQHLMPLIVKRLDWPMARVATLLGAAGADIVSEPLARAAVTATPRQAARLIRYLDTVHCETAIPAVRQIIHNTDDKELITACLRAFKDPDDLDSVRRHLDDPRWEVRVQAVTAIGRMGVKGDVRRLARSLADPEWWVRYRAAQALCALLADSPEVLDRLQHGHPNPFARDVLVQVRAERTLR